MLNVMGKKIFTIIIENFCLSKPVCNSTGIPEHFHVLMEYSAKLILLLSSVNSLHAG